MLIALEDISTQNPEHKILGSKTKEILGTKVHTSYNFRLVYIWNSCKHILEMRRKSNINKMVTLHQIYYSSCNLNPFVLLDLIIWEYWLNTATEPAAQLQDIQSMEKFPGISSPGSL